MKTTNKLLKVKNDSKSCAQRSLPPPCYLIRNNPLQVTNIIVFQCILLAFLLVKMRRYEYVFLFLFIYLFFTKK